MPFVSYLLLAFNSDGKINLLVPIQLGIVFIAAYYLKRLTVLFLVCTL